ncbi:hypothetical protein CBL_00277 [Carabus blaptoides fortunei]
MSWDLAQWATLADAREASRLHMYASFFFMGMAKGTAELTGQTRLFRLWDRRLFMEDNVTPDAIHIPHANICFLFLSPLENGKGSVRNIKSREFLGFRGDPPTTGRPSHSLNVRKISAILFPRHAEPRPVKRN